MDIMPAGNPINFEKRIEALAINSCGYTNMQVQEEMDGVLQISFPTSPYPPT